MPIIGTGSISKLINDRAGFVFLACGVSNSKSVSLSQHLREKEIIFKYAASGRNHIVYFSSLCIYYSNSEYATHKKLIEQYIKEIATHYTIIRIGNIVEDTNPNTLINHLRRDQSIIKEEFRYLIDKEEMNHWIGLIPMEGKHEMNLTGERVSVQEIVLRINNKLI